MSELLTSFRRNAVHVRQALELDARPGAVKVDAGYLDDDGRIERYKRLSIPVRRALNPNDRASFAQALQALREQPGGRDAVPAPRDAWAKLQQELDTQIGLGGGKVARRDILAGWLTAAAFYDKLERDRAYDQLIDKWGKAAESIGAQLMDEAAQVILVLDEAIAAVLGEPVILPPPPKTPPPPKDPEERWWRKFF